MVCTIYHPFGEYHDTLRNIDVYELIPQYCRGEIKIRDGAGVRAGSNRARSLSWL